MMKSQVLLTLFLTAVITVSAFSPSAISSGRFTPRRSAASLQLAATAVPNPFKKLPWIAEKERQREARRMKLERARLHRELGIVEDASYEDIVAATDNLIKAAGDDIKQKTKIEVAKDKILQIRLNERLAGLAEVSKDARAQSLAEIEGPEEVEEQNKNKKEWNAPQWTQGLIVKPGHEHKMKQIKLWGAITALGIVFPGARDYMNRFTWLVCVAQLTFRGMPAEQMEGGGFGMAFGRAGGGGGHRKVAWLLGVSTWIVGAMLVYGLMPTWARGQRWTGSVAFTMQNLIFGVVCSYLQPYKG